MNIIAGIHLRYSLGWAEKCGWHKSSFYVMKSGFRIAEIRKKSGFRFRALVVCHIDVVRQRLQSTGYDYEKVLKIRFYLHRHTGYKYIEVF
jgi:hypothetical protein